MRYIALILVLLIFQQSVAKYSSQTEATVPEADCVACKRLNSMSIINNLIGQTIDRMNDIRQSASDVSKISDKMDYAKKCDMFVSKDEVKQWGLFVEKLIAQPKYTALYSGPKNIRNLCPKYDSMDGDDKKAMWILFVSAWAHYESSCNPNAKAQGPNGTVAGLLQLDRGREDSYLAEDCKRNDSKSPERSIACGLAMLEHKVADKGEDVFSPTSYWDVLRPQANSGKAQKIMAAICQFPSCGADMKVCKSYIAQEVTNAKNYASANPKKKKSKVAGKTKRTKVAER